MEPKSRFSNLDPAPKLPGGLKQALAGMKRFDHLEIAGQIDPSPTETPQRPCPHCGQQNEKKRGHCWACFKPFAGESSPPLQDIDLILDGKKYSSKDPQLPEDVGRLMGWIQKEGYSPQLLAKWRQWRATRNQALYQARDQDPTLASLPQNTQEVEIYKGQRANVIRMDGQRYTSDEKNLPPEIQALFAYLKENNVTPELMDHLRRFGSKVKYRPSTIANPSDGDVNFWDGLKNLFDQ